MDKKEMRKLFSKDKFEEISHIEFLKIHRCGELSVQCSDGELYFKPKTQYPVVFQDHARKITITRGGSMLIEDKHNENNQINFAKECSRHVLISAVKFVIENEKGELGDKDEC